MTNWQKQFANLRHKQQLMYILVFSLATVLVWISVSLFTSQKKTEIPPALLQLAKPLTPTINREVLGDLQTKRAYSASELQAFPIYKIITNKSGDAQKVTIDTPDEEDTPVVPSPSPTPVVAASPEVSPAPEAVVTPSATPTQTVETSPSPTL